MVGRVGAEESLDQSPPNVLVIFSSKNGEVDDHQRMLDLLLGHFSEQITFKSSYEVKEVT